MTLYSTLSTNRIEEKLENCFLEISILACVRGRLTTDIYFPIGFSDVILMW